MSMASRWEELKKKQAQAEARASEVRKELAKFEQKARLLAATYVEDRDPQLWDDCYTRAVEHIERDSARRSRRAKNAYEKKKNGGEENTPLPYDD